MIKTAVKSIVRSLGFDITRRCPDRSPFSAQERLLEATKIGPPVIFDIGANRGQCTEEYRTRFPDAMIYCFEAFPEPIAALESRFGDDELVTIVPKAVADRVGRSEFYVNEFHPTNSLLPRPNSGRRYFPKHAGPRATVEVETITIDSFLADAGIEDVSILKLDIQGAELMALRGSQKLLQSGSVPLIFTESMFVPHYQGGTLYHELCAFLETYGYSLYDFYDLHRAKNGQLRYGDALFVSSEFRSNVIDRKPEEP